MLILKITSQEQHLHIATADGAPGFDLLANSIAGLFTGKEEALSLEAMHDHNPNWDPLFPFSAVGPSCPPLLQII